MKIKYDFYVDFTTFGIGIRFDYIKLLNEFDILISIGPFSLLLEIIKLNEVKT